MLHGIFKGKNGHCRFFAAKSTHKSVSANKKLRNARRFDEKTETSTQRKHGANEKLPGKSHEDEPGINTSLLT